MKSVVFCASQRFKKDMEDFIGELKSLAAKKSQHIVVFEPNFEERPQEFLARHEKNRMDDPMYRTAIAGMVYDHLFRKVRVADVCFIFNKDGYLGVNTSGELFAAAILGKTVYALDHRTLMGSYPKDLYEEPSPKKLIHEVVSSPKELLKRLI